jgi:hypothetical protein
MSREAHRELMPNHLLQWEAIRWAREGMYGLRLRGSDRLEPDDRCESIGSRRLQAQLIRTQGWDYAVRPGLYAIYTRLLPRILAVMRSRGRAQTLRSIE